MTGWLCFDPNALHCRRKYLAIVYQISVFYCMFVCLPLCQNSNWLAFRVTFSLGDGAGFLKGGSHSYLYKLVQSCRVRVQYTRQQTNDRSRDDVVLTDIEIHARPHLHNSACQACGWDTQRNKLNEYSEGLKKQKGPKLLGVVRPSPDPEQLAQSDVGWWSGKGWFDVYAAVLCLEWLSKAKDLSNVRQATFHSNNSNIAVSAATFIKDSEKLTVEERVQLVMPQIYKEHVSSSHAWKKAQFHPAIWAYLQRKGCAKQCTSVHFGDGGGLLRF